MLAIIRFYTPPTVWSDVADIISVFYRSNTPSLHPTFNSGIFTPGHKKRELEVFIVVLNRWIISLSWSNDQSVGVEESSLNTSLINSVTSGNADMGRITTTAMAYVTWHVTYFRDLRIYIRSLESKEDVEKVTYGMDIPEAYQSEPLKAMMAQKS